jgi:hypothetical protein
VRPGTVRNEEAGKKLEAMELNRAKAILLDVTDFDAINPILNCLSRFGKPAERKAAIRLGILPRRRKFY